MDFREPPLTRLPPELLALIFEGLDEEEKTLCATTHKYWQTLIKSLWPVLPTNPTSLLLFAAKSGTLSLMKLAKGQGATHFDWAFSEAAMCGHLDCMKLAKEWDATSEWSATYFNWALENAKDGGHLECMELLRKWIRERYEV